ncbi:MAG: metallopeptidase family protein [Thermoleophilaceae bacterium]
MRDTLRAPLRAAAIAAFTVGMLLFLLNPPELSGAEDLVTLIVGAIALVLFTAWLTVLLMGDGPSEREMERVIERSETLARLPPADRAPSDFDELVLEALDELPEELQRVLRTIPVVVSRQGREHGAYGHYYGDTVARDNYPDRIIIYQDTLERDFGHDDDLLRSQVRRTVRHELAHHLGWDEPGVRDLGL